MLFGPATSDGRSTALDRREKELDEREQRLNQREVALDERERALREQEQGVVVSKGRSTQSGVGEGNAAADCSGSVVKKASLFGNNRQEASPKQAAATGSCESVVKKASYSANSGQEAPAEETNTSVTKKASLFGNKQQEASPKFGQAAATENSDSVSRKASLFGNSRQQTPQELDPVAPAEIETNVSVAKRASLFGSTEQGASPQLGQAAATETSESVVKKASLFGNNRHDASPKLDEVAAKESNAGVVKKASLFGNSNQEASSKAKEVAAAEKSVTVGKKASLFGDSSQDVLPTSDQTMAVEKSSQPKSFLFGAPPPNEVEFSRQAADAVADGSAADLIDQSCPGSASQLRARFEQKGTDASAKRPSSKEVGGPSRGGNSSTPRGSQVTEVASKPSLFGGSKATTSTTVAEVAPVNEGKPSLFGNSMGSLKSPPVVQDDDDSSEPESSLNSAAMRRTQTMPVGGTAKTQAATPQKTSLFGDSPSSPLFGSQSKPISSSNRDQANALFDTESESPQVAIDSTDPGSANELRAKFERRASNVASTAATKTWAPKMTTVSLPDGSGTTKVQARGAVGGVYKQKSTFSQAPPQKKSFADLP
eukprot:TRINITY_DN56170_c0_g1_i1.p1 TRINITY_DN56170_c0_g1~~TRINITY_DN56170_c0_g1_i1.p1  ORF type:complete len:599 (-),score=147.00 TRINITY_DN56170_c0_g1_i1:97-1893(-)